MSDALIGGASSSQLDFVSASSSPAVQTLTLPASSSPSVQTSTSPASYARFHGCISTSLPSDRLAIQRTGYAAFRTPDQPPTAFGRSVWDIDPYAYLALRVRSDGRAYYVNVQTESVEPTDLHQHRLFSKRPGQWETILIRWNDFVRTNHGFVVEPQTEILRQKVHSVGIGLTDRVQGPFELCIERVWATNGMEEQGKEPENQDGELKNKKGEKIQW